MTADNGRIDRLRRLGRPAIRILRRNKWLDKWLYILLLHRRVKGKDPVLIYTIGKVGSTSLQDAIQVATNRPVVHLHRMTGEGIDFARAYREEVGYQGRPMPDWRGEYVRWRVRNDQRNAPWDTVMGVREPIGRGISGFFENAEVFNFLDSSTAPDEVDFEVLTDRFLAFYSRRLSGDWFSDEFLPATGLDVYQKPFPWEAGCETYQNDRFRALLLRYEDLPRAAPTALQDFFGLSEPVLLPARNIGAKKGYAQIYERFLQRVQIPARLTSAAYESKQARHFYSPAEIETFRNKWMRAGGVEA